MTYTRALLVAVAALAVGACSDDEGPTTLDTPPLAYVRYVHAVPDTTATDWRPVDQLEYSPAALGLAYRAATPYQAMEAGSRHLRIFPTSTDISVTSVPLIDETIDFDAGVYYTIIHTGYARTGASPEDHLDILTDNSFTAAPAGQYGIRVVNLTDAAYDLYATADTVTATPLPATPMFDDVPAGQRTAFVNSATGALVLRLTASGGTTVISKVAAPAGSAGDASLHQDPIAGTTVGGSLLTVIIFPGAVAADGTVGNPRIAYLLENRPPTP